AGLAVDICGSCNAVKRDGNGRLVGDMFDGEGFVAGLRGKGREVRGTSALVVGSGGVGSAIAASLAQAGARRLALFDIDGEACDRLAGRLRPHYPDLVLETGSNDPQGHDIVVNATPVGMKPDDSLPMDAERIVPGSFVGDVVLAQEETPFLAAARARGCLTQAGIDMVFEQVPACLEFFGFPTAAPEELRRLAELED
ncbi:MAG: shikimate dehydrogenase, partial [Alphaproteobacteria bacterium]|nr:shikimate dehydrogenase [Alphaproteobacteria bacterium]